MSDLTSVQQAANKVGSEFGADVYLFSGSIYYPSDNYLLDIAKQNKKSKNAVVVLTTYGGDPDAAYRAASYMQNLYDGGEIIIIVNSVCKSAGTLMVIGAHRVIMTDTAELGPIDIQQLDPDDIAEYKSGLTSMQALSMLQAESLNLFMNHFKRLHEEEGFPTKLASQVASEHVTGLFGSIYSQLDPNRLGENQRAIGVGFAYGDRLSSKSGSISNRNLWQLVASFPSHSFVIDRNEAENLFTSVQKPSDAVCGLLEELGDSITEFSGKSRRADIRYLGSHQTTTSTEEHEHPKGASSNESIEPNGVLAADQKGGGDHCGEGDPGQKPVGETSPIGASTN